MRLRRTITFSITYEHPLENLSYAPACTHNLGERTGQVRRDNSSRVRTHENNSRYAVRGLGTKIQNIFVPNQEPAFALIFGNGLVKVGSKWLFCLCSSRLFSRADSQALVLHGCFFFFLYCPVLY